MKISRASTSFANDGFWHSMLLIKKQRVQRAELFFISGCMGGSMTASMTLSVIYDRFLRSSATANAHIYILKQI